MPAYRGVKLSLALLNLGVLLFSHKNLEYYQLIVQTNSQSGQRLSFFTVMVLYFKDTIKIQ